MKKLSRAEQELKDFEDVFGALSHATRRHVLVVLNSSGGKMLAGDIAARFSCSWPTTTRHLKVLEKAGLVQVTRDGREQIYEIKRSRFAITKKWLAWFEGEK